MDRIRSKTQRLIDALDAIALQPRAKSGLELYAMLSETLNEREDAIWGADDWHPPRTFKDGVRTERLYPISTESFVPVPGFPGVTALLARREVLFVSRYGALEVQEKLREMDLQSQLLTAKGSERVIYQLNDSAGDGVWHTKNAD